MTKETKKPDIMLPEAACEMCGFTGEERLQLHAAEDTLIILKEKMTAMELVHAIDALGEIASNLTVHLAKACGFCDNCGDEDPGEDCAAKVSVEQRKSAGRGPIEWVKDCDLCLELLEAGQVIRLPERLLEEAGIPKGSKLEAYADKDSGEITVAKAEGQYDIGDVPPELRAVLARSGVCLAELDDLISQEEIVYGNK